MTELVQHRLAASNVALGGGAFTGAYKTKKKKKTREEINDLPLTRCKNERSKKQTLHAYCIRNYYTLET